MGGCARARRRHSRVEVKIFSTLVVDQVRSAAAHPLAIEAERLQHPAELAVQVALVEVHRLATVQRAARARPLTCSLAAVFSESGIGAAIFGERSRKLQIMDALSRLRDQFAASAEALAGGPDMPLDGAGAALQRAVEHLLSLQDADGWWKGELETNVTMDAEDMLLRRVPRHPRTRRRQHAPPTGFARSSATTAPGATSTAAPPTCRRRSSPTSRCGSPATRPDERAHAHGCASTFAAPAACSRRACSRTSGWRCSAPGPGIRCRRCRLS